MSSSLEKSIFLPFTISPQGIVQTTTDQPKIWQDRVLAVIGTNIGERINRYSFGSTAYTQVYRTAEAAIDGITSGIKDAFSSFLPLLTLVKVDASHDMANNVVNVTIFYQLPNKELMVTSLGQYSINGNNPAKEN